MVLGEEIMSEVAEGVEAVSDKPSEAQVVEEAKVPSGDGARKLHVLVVDDDRLARLMHRTIFESLGHDVELAENGQKAVDLHLVGASFDLILMDRDMPIKNGAEATRELRAMGVKTMIVGVTGHEEGPERQDFVESGLDVCFAKPFKVKEATALVNVIAEKEKKNPEN